LLLFYLVFEDFVWSTLSTSWLCITIDHAINQTRVPWRFWWR